MRRAEARVLFAQSPPPPPKKNLTFALINRNALNRSKSHKIISKKQCLEWDNQLRRSHPPLWILTIPWSNFDGDRQTSEEGFTKWGLSKMGMKVIFFWNRVRFSILFFWRYISLYFVEKSMGRVGLLQKNKGHYGYTICYQTPEMNRYISILGHILPSPTYRTSP